MTEPTESQNQKPSSAEGPKKKTSPDRSNPIKKIVLFAGVFLLIVIAFGVGYYLFSGEKTPEGGKYGIEGKVIQNEPIEEKNEVYVKSKIELDSKVKAAYEAVYETDYDFSNFHQISGKVLAVDPDDQSVKLAVGENEGWVKISSEWHGNVVIWQDDIGDYAESDVLNVAKNDWLSLVEYLRRADKVIFNCVDENCAEAIGGHLYFD